MPLWVNGAIISTHTGSRTHDPLFSGLRFISLERGLARHCAENMRVLKARVVCLAGSCSAYKTSAFCWSLLIKCLIEKYIIIGLLVDTLCLLDYESICDQIFFKFFVIVALKLFCNGFGSIKPVDLFQNAEIEHSTCSHLAFRMLSAISRV